MNHFSGRKIAVAVFAVAALALTASAQSKKERCLFELQAIGEEGTNAFGRMVIEAEKGEKASKSLHESLQTLQALKGEYREVNKDYSRITRKIEEANQQDRQKLKEAGFRQTILKQLEVAFQNEERCVAKYKGCVSDNGGVVKLKTDADNAYREYKRSRDLWSKNLEKAQAHYYKCRLSDCERYYREVYDAKSPRVDNLDNSIQSVIDRVRDDYAEVSQAMEGVKDAIGDCEEVPERIAGFFGFDAVSDMTSLIEELKKMRVRFIISGQPPRNDYLYPNEPIQKPDYEPETEGKVFCWWQVEGQHVEFDGFGKPAPSDLRLEAAWAYRLYSNGFKGVRIPEWIGKISQEDLDAFGTPSKEGCEFLGWEDEDGNLVSAGTPIRKNTRITERYKKITHEIAWYHEGNIYKSQQYDFNQKVEKISLPCEDCLRWAKEKDGNEEWDGFGKPLPSDVTLLKLYAVHAPPPPPPEPVAVAGIVQPPPQDRAVIIYCNGAEIGRSYVKNGEKLPVDWLTNNIPSRAGYTFEGYDRDLDPELVIEQDEIFTAKYHEMTFMEKVAKHRVTFPAPILLVVNLILLVLIYPISLIGRKSGKAA